MSIFEDAQLKLEDFWDENSNTILTVGALIGFGTALFFTARGAVKADRKVQKLSEEKRKSHEELTSKEIIKTAAPDYIPALVASAFTVACIISNHNINEEDKIALCGAYAMLGKSYEKYRTKTREIAGEETAKKIDIAMAEDVRIRGNGGVFDFHDDLQDLEHTAADECIFYDPLSELYFHKTPEDVRLAEYHLNRNLTLRGEVSLWEFYRFLGVDHHVVNSRRDRKKLRKLGWGCDFLLDEYEQTWVDFDHEFVELDSNKDEPSGYYILQPVIQPRVLDEPIYLQ
jgi:hypothetical protein